FDQEIDGLFEARARGDHATAEAIVERRLEEHHALALLAVVVRHREQIHRLGGVHRPVAEVELGHLRRHGPTARGRRVSPRAARAARLAILEDRCRTCAPARSLRPWFWPCRWAPWGAATQDPPGRPPRLRPPRPGR